DPRAAHRVMHGWEDAHRRLIGIFTGDALIHVEQIAVTLANAILAEAADGFAEIEINAEPAGSDAASFIAHFLGGTRGNVARGEVAEAGILALEKIIAIRIRNRRRCFREILLLFRHPDAAVVPQRLGHECEFGLMLAAHRDAGR